MSDPVAEAKQAIAEGRWAQGIGLLEDTVAQTRANTRALRTLVSAYVGAQVWDRAVAHTKSLIEETRTAAPIHHLEAYSWLVEILSRHDIAALQREYEPIGRYLDALLSAEQASGVSALFPCASTIMLSARDAVRGGQWLRRAFPNAAGIDLPVVISPVKSVEKWCLEAGATYREFEPPERITARNGALVWRYQTEAYSFALIPHGEILCGWDFSMAPSGEVLTGRKKISLAGPEWFPHAYSPNSATAMHLWPDDVQYIDEDVLLLSGARGFHTGHWIVEFLPRLRVVKAIGWEGLRIAVPKELPAKQREALAFFGIDSGKIMECELGKRYRFRNLVDVRPGEPLHLNIPTAQFLREGFLVEPAGGGDINKRIFLIRSHPTRRIVNMEEVRSELETYGFVYMDLAEESLGEQRIRLAGAEIVVSTHGSDLLAVLSMPPGSDLIELNYSTVPTTAGLMSCTDSMGSMLNINYHRLLCGKSTDGGMKRQKKDSDFEVDCSMLKGLLNSILQRKAQGQKYHSPIDVTVERIG